MWSHLAFLQVGHLIFLPPSTNEVKWPSVKRGLLPEKPRGNWTRKGGKVRVAIGQMSQPSALHLLLNTAHTESLASNRWQRVQLERVFIEVRGEEGRSTVILVLGWV